MARSGDTAAAAVVERGEIWGTLEELLLAFAVSRHGTRSWDSVAMEVRSRSPAPHHLLLTPEICEERYRHLQRRFAVTADEITADGDGGNGAVEIPWLDELRKLRVAELRREVQRYDVSIGSLQLKVKRLKEERERSFREAADGEEERDAKTEEGTNGGGSPGSTPEDAPGYRISGGDSGRSCKESNSTDPKEQEEREPGSTPAEPPPATVSGDRGADLVAGGGGEVKSAGEASYNGSSDTVAKAAAAEPEADPARRPESGESVAESKGDDPHGDGDGAKETSDVQSSASLSRRRRRGRRRKAAVSGCSSGGDEPDADAVSPAAKRAAAAVESQPLIAFLDVVRSDKHGAVFERRLESQESVRYRSLIRRHMDLEMVRARLEGRAGGGRAYTSAEFFRDLLLICNNALIYFPKKSAESVAAVHLRELVAKEMAKKTIRKLARPPPPPPPPPAKEPTSPPLSQPPPPPPPAVSKLSSDPDRTMSVLEKPALAPLVACRKRSSISSKPAKAATKDAKEEKEKTHVDKVPEMEEEQSAAKKKTKERSAVSGLRGLRSNKTRGSNGNRGSGGILKSPNSNSTPNPKTILAESPPEPAAKPEKKNGGGEASATAKKRSAANFLNRMKRSSSSSNGTLMDTLKNTSAGGGGGKGAEPKRGGRGGDGRKDQRQSALGAASSPPALKRPATEQGAPVKRSVGRPPKRAAAPPAPPPAKRQRGEEARTPPPAKKRGRR